MVMNDMPNGLAATLRASLGTRWPDLHPDIRARFTLAPGITRQSFEGTMQVVNRSAFGWLIAKLIAFVRILPAQRARDVPFTFNLTPAPAPFTTGWVKERLYRFRDECFEFRSVMRIAENGGLIEQFPWGLGMKIRLAVEGHNGDTLVFRDNSYFLRIGAWRTPLPRWLTAGRFTLAHRNIDRERFTVEISLDHPLLGRLFYQYGTFSESPACVTAGAPLAEVVPAAAARVLRPDTAHRAVRGMAHP